MAWAVMKDVMQWVDGNGDPASGYVIKAYEPGTTTPISIAIDRNGGSPQSSVTLNAEGKPEVSGNEVMLYIDRDYKWAIFETQADADANSNPYAGFYDNVPLFLFTQVKSSSESTYDVTSADIGYETKMTAASNVVLRVDSSSGWNIGDEAVFYYPSATGGANTLTTTGTMTVNDTRAMSAGYKCVIKYEGSDVFNWTGP